MEWVAVVLLMAITGVVAFLIGKNRAPEHTKVTELENLIVEKDAEIQQYRERVSKHFEQTANLFGKVTQEYQALYQHMANSSQALIGAQPFKAALENSSAPPELESDFKGEDTFSNESFYKAHEYRNQDVSDEVEQEDEPVKEEIKPETTADIIHLDKAKDESSSGPALDYAVKEKGVINHNSLNMENVKT